MEILDNDEVAFKVLVRREIFERKNSRRNLASDQTPRVLPTSMMHAIYSKEHISV